MFLDPRRSADAYIVLEVISTQEQALKKDLSQPDCAFYAGVIAGFFSCLSGDQFEVIEPDCQSATPNICKFILGRAEVLNALVFWQTLDQN
ncbi:MAG: hypothetical protein HC934_05045 [Acaryochloridaceae cyanobacterium SU_2_1]|nr:hypothetical protein [Acaryochloridaceae cyanobacterium SU_2_1]